MADGFRIQVTAYSGKNDIDSTRVDGVLLASDITSYQVT